MINLTWRLFLHCTTGIIFGDVEIFVHCLVVNFIFSKNICSCYLCFGDYPLLFFVSLNGDRWRNTEGSIWFGHLGQQTFGWPSLEIAIVSQVETPKFPLGELGSVLPYSPGLSSSLGRLCWPSRAQSLSFHAENF